MPAVNLRDEAASQKGYAEWVAHSLEL
jgi:hypothetical protein